MLFLILLGLYSVLVSGDGFDRALHFPKEASLDNYVILKPDFSAGKFFRVSAPLQSYNYKHKESFARGS